MMISFVILKVVMDRMCSSDFNVSVCQQIESKFSFGKGEQYYEGLGKEYEKEIMAAIRYLRKYY